MDDPAVSMWKRPFCQAVVGVGKLDCGKAASEDSKAIDTAGKKQSRLL
jgi:hypothetical protein